MALPSRKFLLLMIGARRRQACVEIAATGDGMRGASWGMRLDCVKWGGVCRSCGVGAGHEGTKGEEEEIACVEAGDVSLMIAGVVDEIQ